MGLITPNDNDDLRSHYTGQLQYLLSTETPIVKGLESMIDSALDTQRMSEVKAVVAAAADFEQPCAAEARRHLPSARPPRIAYSELH